MDHQRTILSLEQALSLPSATLRFAQLGWRVIRIEATQADTEYPGDPNRYIGEEIGGYDRRSYFLAQNVGKEAICLNLKEESGRNILHRLIKELDVDVFTCNTLPSRYQDLGIDFETLKAIKPDLIWAGISAMGPEAPSVPGYDPVLQAMAGFMDVTGDPDGSPTLMGLPLIDLKAGDEVYAGVWKALVHRAETGLGSEINVSMLQVASSWLITTMSLLDFDPDPAEVTRCGNQHRKFIPTDTFKTKDGHIYIAVGNDIQWKRLTDLPKFAPAVTQDRITNAGRHREREEMYEDLRRVVSQYTNAELTKDLESARIPFSKVNNVHQVRKLDAIRSRLTKSVTPDGKEFLMQPMATDMEGAMTTLPFPPAYGEHTQAVLLEAGYSIAEFQGFRETGIVADKVRLGK